jgi:hypothetical protein
MASGRVSYCFRVNPETLEVIPLPDEPVKAVTTDEAGHPCENLRDWPKR